MDVTGKAMKNQGRAYLFAAITVLLWSTVATAFKIALRDLNNIEVLLIANLTSLVVFLGLLLVSGKTGLLKKETPKSLAFSAFQGLLNPFAYYLILFKAYSLLPAQVAQPTNFIWPVVLMLLSAPLLKQPIRLTGVIALLVSFTGVLILSSQGNLSHFRIVEPAGIALSLSTSVIWAFYWIFNLRDHRDDLVKLFLGFLFSSVYILIVAAFTGTFTGIFQKPLMVAVYIGLFEMGITFALWLKALQLSDSTGKVANLIYITPFASLLFIHFVLHEELYYTSFIGLALIIAGILAGRIKKRA
ncbi:MAG: DMT family transporter [Bacteroidales bacterium]